MTADQIARQSARDEQTARRIELIAKVRERRAERLLDLAQSIHGVPAMLALVLLVLFIIIWRLSL